MDAFKRTVCADERQSRKLADAVQSARESIGHNIWTSQTKKKNSPTGRQNRPEVLVNGLAILASWRFIFIPVSIQAT
jgi:hypothetical protein